MIKIIETEHGVVVDGHAGYAERGKDIVCAGISALTSTLVESIEQLTCNNPNADVREGYANIYASSPTEDTKLILESFFIGVSMIADEYPDYVQVTRRECQ